MYEIINSDPYFLLFLRTTPLLCLWLCQVSFPCGVLFLSLILGAIITVMLHHRITYHDSVVIAKMHVCGLPMTLTLHSQDSFNTPYYSLIKALWLWTYSTLTFENTLHTVHNNNLFVENCPYSKWLFAIVNCRVSNRL